MLCQIDNFLNNVSFDLYQSATMFVRGSWLPPQSTDIAIYVVTVAKPKRLAWTSSLSSTRIRAKGIRRN
jgi:hypothetical protein